jgi:hypothetical protein
MPTLHFMPWCRIDKAISVGEIEVFPFHVDSAIEGVDTSATAYVKAILATYRNIEGSPIDHCALIRYADKHVIADLAPAEIEALHDLIEVLCFSSLADRELFNQMGPYSNAACFTFYGQRFGGEPGFTAITSRRRDGRTLSGRWLRETQITIPVHVADMDRVKADERLLSAILAYRQRANPTEWSGWQNAVSCFNQANTDDDAVRYQSEWTLLAGAFERILDAKPNAEDVADKFACAVVPRTTLTVGSAKRKPVKSKDLGLPVRHEWMREFYRIRGDFAHGRLDSSQPATWAPLEHLVLASIGFPLLVRVCLARAGLYSFTDDDLTVLDSFEALADADFLVAPDDQRHSMDSVWQRLRREAGWDRIGDRVKAKLEEMNQCDGEGSGAK